MAFGAVKILILTVLQPLKKLKELPVFLIPLVGIPGKYPADGPDHQSVGKQNADQTEGGSSHKDRQHTCNQSCRENNHTEFICTITSVHKLPDALGKLKTDSPEPEHKSVHSVNHLLSKF